MIDLPDDAVRKTIEDPRDFVDWSVTRLLTEFRLAAQSVNQWYHDRFYDAGDLDVMAESWDVLILVDACRYDYFDELCDIDGTLERRRSPGSMSQEFIIDSFVGRKLHDTVYVTANPFVAELPEGTFHDVVNQLDGRWQDDVGTVPPEKMAAATRDALEQYPNKRIISHFMQPHAPFLTPFGLQVMDDLYWRGSQYFPTNVSADDVRRAYRENVEYVLAVVETLVAEIDNEVVVSSDHGELMGERLRPLPVRGWGHPRSIYADGLVEVPWLRIGGESRRVEAEPPVDGASVSTDDIKPHLEALGYR